MSSILTLRPAPATLDIETLPPLSSAFSFFPSPVGHSHPQGQQDAHPGLNFGTMGIDKAQSPKNGQEEICFSKKSIPTFEPTHYK